MAAPVKTPTFAGKVSRKWTKLLALLPGYDCFRDAGDCWFDEETADHVVDFFETRLHHTEGALVGKPIILEPWQKAFLGCLFGWKRPDDTRRYREFLLYVPRKNGKTTILAGIALYMLFCDPEGGQQIFSAAADAKQSSIAHRMAKLMIRRDPDLDGMANVMRDCIEVEDHRYRIISEGFKGQHGLNVNCALIDEVHEHKSREMSDTITSSQGARTQPLTGYATTAAEVGENFCNEIYDYFCAVRDGKFCAAAALPCIYEALIDDNWKLEKTWKKANPNYGITVSKEFYRDECEKAKRIPSYQNTFRRLYLNQRTQSLTVWLDITDWDQCAGLENNETPEEWRARATESLRGCQCWGGLDLGSVSDLTAFSLLFDGAPMGYDDALIAIPYVWCPADTVDNKTEHYRDAYQQWIDRGFMLTTPGGAVDYDRVRKDIVQIVEPFSLVDIGVDTQFQGMETAVKLQEHHGFKIFRFPQGMMAMSAPTQDFEGRVKKRRIIHGANPILRWMAGHCMVATKGDLARPVKESRNNPKKIDALVATIFALGRWHMREKDNIYSHYNAGERLMIL